jgi:glycosyltransferase involved in cell wall biosynthesis
MKISFFIGSMNRGGAERVISILANDYCARGWDVDIVLLLQNAVEYDLDSRIRIVDITKKSDGYLKNAPRWLGGIRKYLKERKPDRVVSFVGRINALVLTASIGLKLPVVISERNDPKHDGRGAFMQWYCNRIYHQAKAIVYQNEHEKSCFSKSLEKKGCIIPNPVSVAAVKTESSDVIATAGRLIEQKNQKILVSAMAQVHKVYPDVKCRIYGEGALREALQTQIDELGLQDIVTLEGNVKDIHARLSQCGIFALTSNFEGLSNALIEAMQVGLACITTDYPGARELITDGENGLVVPMNDADALAKSIIKLIENKDGCADTLAQQGKTFAARFNAEAVLTQWHTAIEK